jgi:hypothetical protein
MQVEVVKPRVSNRISFRILCQLWECVDVTDHACRTLVETNGRSIDTALGPQIQERRWNVILAIVRLTHRRGSSTTEHLCRRLRPSLGVQRHSVLSPMIRSVYLGKVSKIGPLGGSHMQANVGVGATKAASV